MARTDPRQSDANKRSDRFLTSREGREVPPFSSSRTNRIFRNHLTLELHNIGPHKQRTNFCKLYGHKVVVSGFFKPAVYQPLGRQEVLISRTKIKSRLGLRKLGVSVTDKTGRKYYSLM